MKILYLPISFVHPMRTSLNLTNYVIFFLVSWSVILKTTFLSECSRTARNFTFKDCLSFFIFMLFIWLSVEYLSAIFAIYLKLMSNDEVPTKISLPIEWFKAYFAEINFFSLNVVHCYCLLLFIYFQVHSNVFLIFKFNLGYRGCSFLQFLLSSTKLELSRN
jgi:hypothetical protein